MSHLWSESFTKHSSTSFEHDIVIKGILLAHDPDGRDPDSEMLLRVIEAIMYHATPSQASAQQQDFFDISSIEEDALEEPLGNPIYHKLSEIICECYGEKNEHASTMHVLNLLGSYRWEAKLLLALSAFAVVYGELWVITQSQNQNSLAAAIALLKKLPTNLDAFKPIFKALTLLVKTALDVIRCVKQFEGLPVAYAEQPDEAISSTKSSIYAAAYWIVRSIMVCISLVTNLRDIKDEQDPNSIVITVWEITSLKSKISSIGAQLRKQVDACQQQTEQKMHKKLLNVFQEKYFDNQEVLRILFALKNDFPLKQSSKQAKLAISSLENKVIILLISKPEPLAIEELLFLVHQTYDHPLHNKLDGSYDIVWMPISPSKKWSNKEVKIFNFLSNSLPWYSIRQPWSLNSININYAKEEWQFEEKPIMVVLDLIGRVTNVNAYDMVSIWGVKAYPFSATREKELWKEEKWNLRLLLDFLDPLLTMWVEEGRTICIYGSDKLNWIREFTKKIKDIQCLVSQFEVVYVGKKDPDELANTVSVIDKEQLSHSLSLTKIYFFWRRLESMRRSKLRLRQSIDTDEILRGVETLLATSEAGTDWAIIGTGSSTNMVKLQGNELVRFLSQFPKCQRYLPKVGLENAIRLSLEPPATKPCSHSRIVKYNNALMEEILLCEKCKHPVEKLIVYDVVE